MRSLRILLMLLGGCDAMPRDIDGISERIAGTHIIRVGLGDAPSSEAIRFLKRIERATGARVRVSRGALEAQLDALDRHRLDLIVAPIRADGLLADAVALTDPLDGSAAGDRPVQWRAAVRNGENRWVMQVERSARAEAGE